MGSVARITPRRGQSASSPPIDDETSPRASRSRADLLGHRPQARSAKAKCGRVRVLVVGVRPGGVGTRRVARSRRARAEVTGVCSSTKVDTGPVARCAPPSRLRPSKTPRWHAADDVIPVTGATDEWRLRRSSRSAADSSSSAGETGGPLIGGSSGPSVLRSCRRWCAKRPRCSHRMRNAADRRPSGP